MKSRFMLYIVGACFVVSLYGCSVQHTKDWASLYGTWEDRTDWEEWKQAFNVKQALNLK